MSYGYRTITDSDLGVFNFSGYLSLLKCRASDARVKGSLTLKDSKVEKIVVHGKLSMQNSEVEGDVAAYGNISVMNSIVNGSISSNTSSMKLENAKVRNIVIRKDKIGGIQTVFLKGTSLVEGDITFESGAGKVIISPEAKFQGKTNGSVQPSANL